MVSQAVGLNRACAQFWVSLGRSNGTPLEGVYDYAVACLLRCSGVLPGNTASADRVGRVGSCWGVLLGNTARAGRVGRVGSCWGVLPGNTANEVEASFALATGFWAAAILRRATSGIRLGSAPWQHLWLMTFVL